jgi:hypothetical protein
VSSAFSSAHSGMGCARCLKWREARDQPRSSVSFRRKPKSRSYRRRGLRHCGLGFDDQEPRGHSRHKATCRNVEVDSEDSRRCTSRVSKREKIQPSSRTCLIRDDKKDERTDSEDRQSDFSEMVFANATDAWKSRVRACHCIPYP